MYRHGIYVSEQETSMIAPLNGTAGLQVVIGTAPVHLLADPAAAINKPLLVYSKAEAIAAVGYSDDFASFTLCEAISASFAVVNVAPLVLINVLDPAKHSAEMEEKQLTDKLWDGYELSHSAAEAIRRPVESRPKAARHISELRREMTSLGNPNIGAIDEYARVSERYEFLAGQRDDVEKAKNELLGIIADITGEMRTIFTREFTAINESFRATFTELFGGGKAELTLEPGEDVLSCDIDIKVQPPGKALTTLSLLSGGETAFVAIALYFAIIKVRPTPFCVMDEIEAALDEANVIRFAEHMRQISNKTQFIVITHRRGTMEEADFLYGVTMQEKGVSKVIELDLEEAEKHTEEAAGEWDSSTR